MIRICKKVEGRKVDAEDSDSSNTNCDCWYNPMNIREARPTKHEKTNRHTGAFYASKVEAAFGTVEDGALFSGEVFARDVFLCNAYASTDYRGG